MESQACSPLPEATLVSMFEEQVHKYPTAIAIIDGDMQVTYHELNEQANRLAHYLLKTNGTIKKDSFIAIMLDRSVEFIVSAIAVLKTGAAYLPLDPELPIKRLQFMLSDAQVTKLVTLSKFTKNISGLEIKNIYLDDKNIKSELVTQPNANLNTNINPLDLAYVIYTSGSTGKPKGVMVEHRSVSNLVKNTNYIKINTKDTIAHVSTILFDASIFEIWSGLLNGARIAIYKKSILLNSHQFQRVLIKNRLTILYITTALFHRFILSDPSIFSSIKNLYFGGEKLIDTKILKPLLNNSTIAPKSLNYVDCPYRKYSIFFILSFKILSICFRRFAHRLAY